MTVTFIGHSVFEITPHLKRWLYETINALLLEGATTFLCGGYGQFDALSAYIARHCREYYPEVQSLLVHPYPKRSYDSTIYTNTINPQLEKVLGVSVITQRNEWMVDEADVVVAYVFDAYGGAYKTLTYALEKHKHIISYQFHE